MVDPGFTATMSTILGEDLVAGLAAMTLGRTCPGRSEGRDHLKPSPGKQKTPSEKLQKGCGRWGIARNEM